MMCTKDTAFTIRGVEDCLARGYDRNGFIEVDTGEQKSWTIQRTDPGQPLGGQPRISTKKAALAGEPPSYRFR